jgi:hypothetical protein
VFWSLLATGLSFGEYLPLANDVNRGFIIGLILAITEPG